MALSRLSAADRRSPSRGRISAITIQPGESAPRFTAVVELQEPDAGQAHQVRLVWLGQRDIAGLVPGTVLEFWGRVTRWQGKPVIFNPRYDLLYTPTRKMT